MHVEIWSDIACPWCYIGKRRFETALAAFPHRDEVTVTWRSFELDPEAPAERPGDQAEHLASKYGMSIEQARASQAQITELAAAEGLHYRFDLLRMGRTFDGHRLVHLGAAHDVQDAVKERLMHGYFEEGALVSDPETLVRLGVEAGLPEGEIREMLAGDRFAADVRDDEATAGQLGIRGVPFFVVDRRLGVSGAQPADVFIRMLEQGREPAQPVAG